MDPGLPVGSADRVAIQYSTIGDVAYLHMLYLSFPASGPRRSILYHEYSGRLLGTALGNKEGGEREVEDWGLWFPPPRPGHLAVTYLFREKRSPPMAPRDWLRQRHR